jgi:FkbM family methyltransferase
MRRNLRAVATAALRAPGPHVPGWFPLVAERADRFVGPPPGIHRVELLGCVMELDTREYLQKRAYYHCYEARELAFLERWLRAGDRMIDIGANVGVFTLVGARLVGADGRVDAFEPVPATHDRLLRNIALNGYQCVHPQRAAVTDHSGAVSLGIPEERLVGYSTADFSIGQTLEAVDAPAVTLDGYIDDDRPVRLLKIDAEGSEQDILTGARRVLEEMPPAAVLLELNHAMLTAHGSSTAEVMSTLAAAGYELHTLGPGGRLGPAPSASKVSEAARRWHPHTRPRSMLRIGLATRRLMFNAVAVRADASA